MNALKLTTLAFPLLLVSSVLEMAARADVAPGSPEAVYGPEIEERWFSHSMSLNYRMMVMHRGPHGDQNYDPNDINDVKRAAIDPQMFPRRAAALALLTYQIRGEAKEMLLSALADPYVSVRCMAARSLAILGDPNGLASMRRDFAELTKEPADVDIESMTTKERVRQDFWAKHPYTRLGNALDMAEVLAQFGDTTGFTLASQVILQEEPTPMRAQAARIVAELGKLPDSELRAKHCDPDAVLIAMVEKETDPLYLRSLRPTVLKMKTRPASTVKVLERMEHSPAFSGFNEQDRLSLRRSIESAKRAMAEEAKGPKDR